VLLPVIGRELVYVRDGDRRLTLSRLLAERIATRYQLKIDWGPASSLDDAVAAYLAGRGEGQRLYRVVNDLLSELNPEPPEAMRQLADNRRPPDLPQHDVRSAAGPGPQRGALRRRGAHPRAMVLT
jgi:hypothetical protein